MGQAPLLGSILEYAAVLLEHLATQQVLRDAHTKRLFNVGVLAGSGGHDRDRYVPVVRRGNNHRIDVVAGEELTKIAIGLAADLPSDPLAAILVRIGNGHRLGIAAPSDVAQHGATSISHANVPHRDPVTGRRLVARAQGR
jgi:hypothetical protein